MSQREDLDAIVADVLTGSSDTIERAEGLPPVAYVSQAFFDLEVRSIFRRDWLCVGHVSQVPNVGDYFTIDLAGEPLVVVRALDRIRVMSRLCLHRWGMIAEGRGNVRAFVCPFHRWTYALDGQLTSTVYMEGAAGLDQKNCRLPEIRTEIVDDLGLIFVTFSNDAESISAVLADLCERLTNFHLADLAVVEQSEFDNRYNWKFQIESGMEAFHHFAVHGRTLEPIFPTRLSWCEESKKGWTICHSPAAPGVNYLTFAPFPDVTDVDRPGLDLYLIYPLTRLGVYPDRVRLQLLMPEGPGRTISRRLNLVTREIAAQTEYVKQKYAEISAASRKSNPEDQDINTRQQTAARSSLARGGRLSPLEATVWHLAQYVRGRIRDEMSRNR